MAVESDSGRLSVLYEIDTSDGLYNICLAGLGDYVTVVRRQSWLSWYAPVLLVWLRQLRRSNTTDDATNLVLCNTSPSPDSQSPGIAYQSPPTQLPQNHGKRQITDAQAKQYGDLQYWAKLFTASSLIYGIYAVDAEVACARGCGVRSLRTCESTTSAARVYIHYPASPLPAQSTPHHGWIGIGVRLPRILQDYPREHLNAYQSLALDVHNPDLSSPASPSKMSRSTMRALTCG
jgi:hypothetical protein